MMRPIHGGNLAWAAAVAGCSPSDILDFSASINPLGPPKSVIAAIQAHIGDLSAYPDPNYGELRTALGQWHQLPPEWILPGNGSAELLTWAGWDLAQLAKTYLFTPAFADYYRALKAFGGTIQECPLELEVRGQRSEIGGNVSIALECGLLLNNPHNPTGQMFSQETILPYLEQFALIVVDEAFMDFLPPSEEQSLIPLVQKYPNLVILRSLTKFYSLPGLRLGYAIAHPDRLQSWQQRRDPWSVNTLAAAAAITAIHDSEFQQRTWAWLPPARTQLFEGLAQIPGLHPLKSTANFLLVQCESSQTLQQYLLQHHKILIRDCLSFPTLGDRFFRIAVRADDQNEHLLQALMEGSEVRGQRLGGV
ncbi:threonine-phosphate decarboxylase CobD [Chroogloeocystis siderophila]|uniref:threonine-phosphate decarboxylase n=1 Tax=Chroogloeocystis siderophila 5.2 s.c.1 TaxID=247279 RepID=A0A1U7HX68_9CHRO|nr:threonine-phosphate decarboxylase CobD [Chroogloeocystis siderophila]OKH28152.1 threonine-phosphate decarboxylase [Chroogloeocystis siderophila 5.2 s.c.1]